MSLTEEQLAAKFKSSRRNWDQKCQAAVVNASDWTGGFEQLYASANDARYASKIVSLDPTKAPVNAVHYWSIGTYGHVAGGLGGSRVFMGSKHVDESWGTNVGVTTVEKYTQLTGAVYRGWSKTNGKNVLNVTAKAPVPVKKPVPAKPTPKPYELVLPPVALQHRIQRALGRHGFYTGPDDGEFGIRSLTAIQFALKAFAGYKGPTDGKIEEEGARRIQSFAKKVGGYTGKVDKKLGPNSWAGFATALERTP